MKKRNIWVFLLLYSIIMIGIILIVHILFKTATPNKWLEATWTSGEILTFIASVSLGAISLVQLIIVQNDQINKEAYTHAVNNYVFLSFNDFSAYYYENDNILGKREIQDKDYNGKSMIKRLFFYDSMSMYYIKYIIQNISKFPVINCYVTLNDERVEDSNIKSKEGDRNNTKYILPQEEKELIIGIKLEQISSQKILHYYIEMENIFGDKYSQEIEIKYFDAGMGNAFILISPGTKFSVSPRNT